jgi:FkbM family methyltransferase
MPGLGNLTRKIWLWSNESSSTWHESSKLWQGVWLINRLIGRLPRAQIQIVDLQISQKVRMRLDLSRLTDVFVYCYGIGEFEIGFLARLLCRNDTTFVDIGANIGSTSLAFAEIATEGRVLAFEPSASMRAVLLENITLNGFTNIQVFPFGLSDSTNIARLNLEMVGNPGSAYCTIAEVEDKVLEKNLNVDFIKIDVEGFEYRVLSGTKRIISKNKPVLVVEINERALSRAGTSGLELITLMEEWGYKLFILINGRFCKYSLETNIKYGLHNVVAIHPEDHSAWSILEKNLVSSG